MAAPKKKTVDRRALYIPAHGTALSRVVFTDIHTGNQYPTRALMMTAQRQRKAMIMNEFERLVAEGTLGQEPWEQLPGESPVYYSRFRTYLTMTPQDGQSGVVHIPRNQREVRSFFRLANHLRVRRETISAVARRYHWLLRAQCWDREMVRQADEAWAEEKSTAARRQARLGARLQQAADRGLNALLTGAIDMTPQDVARLADTGVKLERLAHDKSTSNDAQQKEVRFVFEGSKPKWADHSEEVVVAPQIEAER